MFLRTPCKFVYDVAYYSENTAIYYVGRAHCTSCLYIGKCVTYISKCSGILSEFAFSSKFNMQVIIVPLLQLIMPRTFWMYICFIL